ncbi:30S ribosomal protein S9 [Candidatus Woesearchaeota archaeon]|nr:30S ribosomal protein S9 [Candidatus Woesearchaeota archaeon]
MKTIVTSGKRKRAIATASLKAGRGVVRINSLLLENYTPKLAQLKIMEPLIIAEKYAHKVDIAVSVTGGGFIAQAEAARLSIAKALVAFANSQELKDTFLKYDRQLLIADVRRKEPAKPNDSKARAKRQKSYR